MANRTTAAGRPSGSGRTARSARARARHAVVSNPERRATTRRAVLDAAAVCFDERGYLATRLDDITERAKLTKGAVYFHFGSKEALATAVIQEHTQLWPAVLDDLTGRPGSALDHLVALTYEVARTLRDNVCVRAGMKLSLDPDVPGIDPAAALDRWTDAVADLLRKARRAGELSSDVAPAAGSRFVVANFLGIYQLASVIDGTPDAHRRLDEFWSLALPRLRAERPRPRPLRGSLPS